MKSISLLSRIAIVAIVAATGGLIFNALSLALFAVSASALVLLVAAGDYARRPNYLGAVAARAAVSAARRAERMPLAA